MFSRLQRSFDWATTSSWDKRGLSMRGMPFSLPAAVGFIALGGIAVLNGVVMASEVRRRLDLHEPLADALKAGCAQVLRAVLTTSVVAAFGFLPMAIATSAGAEVQQPLATAVVIGMLIATLLTLVVLPGVLSLALRKYRPAAAPAAATEASSPTNVGAALTA
ncbi:MAG: Cobalt-zinc-cadmium resistance protein CzcA [Polyangiaceae bacterium]|jgi:cobalt-zinc-cadmium resistance protein CzcA|nr:Cobalt-zinc-cadmium resistance protein CzcA [Polyangiaceae bacterium]